ncbi:MAG: GSCFA domain-containing protein [Prevotella sp.]|nr:GSCFA domain-containing protein [Prevotella sp.]
MEFRTIVDIEDPGFRIGPCEELLFVGSCFADSIGRRFRDEKFRVTVNPDGVMYNPASILHTVERLVARFAGSPAVAFLTLGTNHVYRLKETGEIVDNCQKRPQALFTEELLTVDECADYLSRAVALLHGWNPQMHVVLTVSPIRYRKYGYHGSQLSKATLLLAVEELTARPSANGPHPIYFPAYEIVQDELRDYRFYKEDMLHPSDQTVEYIWERLSETFLSAEAKTFLREWAPLKAVLAHKPFHPESADYQALMDKTMLKVAALQKKYPNFAL